MSHYCYIHVHKSTPGVGFFDLDELNKELRNTPIGELLPDDATGFIRRDEYGAMLFWNRESETHEKRANVYSCVSEQELAMIGRHLCDGKLLVCLNYESCSNPEFFVLSREAGATPYEFPLA